MALKPVSYGIGDRVKIDHHSIAVAFALSGDLEAAERAFRSLLEAKACPKATAHLGMVLLAQGRYAEGAPLYEARLDAIVPPALPYPRWRGEDLTGKRVLVWPEQGFGDQIMFARFIPLLRSLGCDVTYVCRPQLHRLLAANLDALVLPAAGSIEFPDPDVWLWTCSLLAATGATLETIPAEPYLRADPRGRGGIGVAVKGSPTNTNDTHRSLPPDLAEALLSKPGAVNLDPGATGAGDFQDTAEIIAGLDAVVSVDTSIAHLAGALGKPASVLLPHHGTDWRWGRDRDDSPWYRTAKLLRQGPEGDWRPVLERLSW